MLPITVEDFDNFMSISRISDFEDLKNYQREVIKPLIQKELWDRLIFETARASWSVYQYGTFDVVVTVKVAQQHLVKEFFKCRSADVLKLFGITNYRCKLSLGEILTICLVPDLIHMIDLPNSINSNMEEDQ